MNCDLFNYEKTIKPSFTFDKKRKKMVILSNFYILTFYKILNIIIDNPSIGINANTEFLTRCKVISKVVLKAS